jgi:hypothetical protein
LAGRTLNSFAGRYVPESVVRAALSVIRAKYGLVELRGIPEGSNWALEGKINPIKGTKTKAKTKGPRKGKQTTSKAESADKAKTDAAAKLLGQPLTSAAIAALGRAWSRVTDPAEVKSLTYANSRKLFNNQRKRFWNAVRRDPACVKLLRAAGCDFKGGPGSAPILKHSGVEFRLTLDHITERQSAPHKALSASNLRLSSTRENTVVLRQLHDQDPFQSAKTPVKLRQVIGVMKSSGH